MLSDKNWTSLEDKQLEKLVRTFGSKKWKLLATTFNRMNLGRKKTGKMCKDRWIRILNLASSKQNWSLSEDFLFFELHSVMGNRWSSIMEYLPGKTDNDLKNHFYSNLRKTLRKLVKEKYNYVDFQEKLKAFYILIFLAKCLCPLEDKSIDFDTIHIHKHELKYKPKDYSHDENAYIFKLIKRHQLKETKIQAYLHNLTDNIVNDKYMKERISWPVNSSSIQEVKELLNVLVSYDLMFQGMIYANHLHDVGVDHFKIQEFINKNKNILDVLQLEENLSRSNLKFINNYKIFNENISGKNSAINYCHFSPQIVNLNDNKLTNNKNLNILKSLNFKTFEKICMTILVIISRSYFSNDSYN